MYLGEQRMIVGHGCLDKERDRDLRDQKGTEQEKDIKKNFRQNNVKLLF